jgi:hypothetical protein
MDTLTFTLVILVFLASLALYFATLSRVIPTPLPEKPKSLGGLRSMDFEIAPVLRQNVAVARLLR